MEGALDYGVMSRLGSRDVARARDLSAALCSFEDGDGPILPRITRDLRDYLGAARTFSYGVVLEEGGCRVQFWHASRSVDQHESLTPLVDRWFSSGEDRFALYTPARVERFQQNRAMEVRDFECLARGAEGNVVSVSRLGLDTRQQEATLQSLGRGRPVFRKLGILEHQCLRALICDGSALTAWIGAFQPEPIRMRQRQLLQAVTPALGQRLRLETRLGDAPLHFAALEAALEKLPGPAYIVGPGVRIRLANSAGRLRLDQDRAQVIEGLREGLCGRNLAYSLTRLSGPGLAVHHLAIEHNPVRDPAIRAAAARRRYGLTVRQQTVLSRVLRGESNKCIALALECSERTVEVHITHLLARIGVDSRAALIASLWIDAP